MDLLRRAMSATAGEAGKMRHAIFRFIVANRGATAIEYGVIAAGIALVIAGAVALMGGNFAEMFGWLSEQINTADTSGDAADT